MKPLKFLLISSILFLIPFGPPEFSKAEEKDDLYKSFITLLSPYIIEELKKNNLQDRSFELFEAEILEIGREGESYTFYPVVKIRTYTGAHNPPYGEAIIRFKVSPSGVETLSFKYNQS